MENKRSLMPWPHCCGPVLPQERPEGRAWKWVGGEHMLGLSGSFLCVTFQIN